MSVLGGTRRDRQIIGVVGIAHLLSHYYQFVLPPVFVLIAADLGVSFIALGSMMGVLFLTSALCQTPAGFLVDRIGGRPVLFSGLFLLASATTGYAFAPNYETLIALSIVAGIGNSVFHPADYSMLNARVSPKWMGRAYSVHSIGGYLGFALAPASVALLAGALGWRMAVGAVGIAGIVIGILLCLWRGDEDTSEDASGTAKSAVKGLGATILLRPQILLSFFFFVVLAMGLIGLQSFATTSLVAGWSMSLETAGLALSVFVFAAPVGILIGGYVADHMPSPHTTAGIAFAGAGLSILAIPLLGLGGVGISAAFLAAGLLFGFGLPSRDMFIRSMTPKGASGRIFGFIYGGLDTGAAITPVLFGLFVDHDKPQWVFIAAGLFIISAAMVCKITSIVAIWSDKKAETLKAETTSVP
jgi:FSR family fosmidomycin resistance protein-like MFS transporter